MCEVWLYVPISYCALYVWETNAHLSLERKDWGYYGTVLQIL